VAEDAGVAIEPDDGAYAFETLLRHNRAYTGYAHIATAPWIATFAQHSPFAQAYRSSGENTTGSVELRAELSELPPEEWPTVLRRLLSEQISLILRRTIDPDRTLTEYGLDSLGLLELRTRIENQTGVRLSATDITTVSGLAQLLCDKLVPVDAA
jgi:polyketide synthase 5